MNIAEAMKPPNPTKPCYNCGGTEYWWREKGWGDGGWLCSRCHPCPNSSVAAL
jgi:transposase